MADMKLMSDWEEMEGIQDDFSNLEIDEKEDDDSRVLMIPNASHLDSNDVQSALMSRGIAASGFIEIDREKLQHIFNDEFRLQEEKSHLERIENRKKAAQQAGLQRKRMDMEQKLQEEINELAVNYQVNAMIECIKENNSVSTIKLDVNSISARALAKAMWLNHTIICLDLSSNNLDDNAGGYIARILKRNNTLKKMELDNNNFGPNTCKAFAESLVVNTSLVHLSLDSNPLTGPVTEDFPDFSGVEAFSQILSVNKTIMFLNLWRTNLGIEGGVALADGLDMNTTILFCDVGQNGIHANEAIRIATRLDENLASYEKSERQRREDVLTEEEKAKRAQDAIDAKRKEEELKIWLDSRREERSLAKKVSEEARILKEYEERERLRKKAAEEREARRKFEEEEAIRKQKKKEKAAKKK